MNYQEFIDNFICPVCRSSWGDFKHVDQNRPEYNFKEAYCACRASFMMASYKVGDRLLGVNLEANNEKWSYVVRYIHKPNDPDNLFICYPHHHLEDNPDVLANRFASLNKINGFRMNFIPDFAFLTISPAKLIAKLEKLMTFS